MPAGEAHHVSGENGIRLARKWLDRTTRVRIRYAVYDYPELMLLPQLNGTPKAFDLAGDLIDENGKPRAELYVEVKHYLSAEGNQSTEYRDYIARCYSITANAMRQGLDRGTEFMWLTWHPFSLNRWSRLCTSDAVVEALEHDDRRGEYLGTVEFDHVIADTVAERAWLVVLGQRHEELVISDWLMEEIRSAEERRSTP